MLTYASANERKTVRVLEDAAQRYSNIGIANILGISRQAVSTHSSDGRKDRIDPDGHGAGKPDRIEKIDTERGVLIGSSIPFRAAAIIFVSENHGMQVWYEHEGDCETCQRYTECIELLWDYATELGIKIRKTADPTKMAEELFEKVKAMI